MKEVKTISIIIPIYKGNNYIPSLFRMVQENWKSSNKIFPTKIEMIFVNDFPDEELKMENHISENISCTVITNKKNCGIHFSRVQGFLCSKGKYILFLDQDDQISPVYIREQLIGLGDGDAIICNGKNRGALIYRNVTELTRVTDIAEYRRGYNQIVSPGQVLIKREAIPCEWTENILQNNGADDFFLWLLILWKKCTVSVQNRVLYWHVLSDESTSNDFCSMDRSVLEMAHKMVQLGCLSCEEEEYIRQCRINAYRREGFTAAGYQKEKAYKEVLEFWMVLRDRRIFLKNFFKKKSFYNIAIYGEGILGKHLYYELLGSEIKVKCFLDRNGRTEIAGIETFMPGDNVGEVDVIIVTPFMEYMQIREQLKKHYSCKIISIQTVLLNADCELEAD